MQAATNRTKNKEQLGVNFVAMSKRDKQIQYAQVTCNIVIIKTTSTTTLFKHC